MIGDLPDVVARLKAVLPRTWFPTTQAGSTTNTPILDGVLNGVGWGLSWLYSLLQYVYAQGRLKTASGVFLDLFARDYFGVALPRLTGEQDIDYRWRIGRSLLAEKGTRAGMINALVTLTGRKPIIVVPSDPRDTGGWDIGIAGWDRSGAWGDLDLPYQAFITAFRPHGGGGGIPGAPGWDQGPGGWDTSPMSWTDMTMVKGQVTDEMIYATIVATAPEGTIPWTAISN